MHRSKAMPAGSAADRDGDPEEFNRVLEDFDNFGRAEQPRIRSRRSLLEIAKSFSSSGRGVALPVVSPVSESKGSTSSGLGSDNSERNSTMTSTGSTSTLEPADSGFDSSLGESASSIETSERRAVNEKKQNEEYLNHEPGDDQYDRDPDEADVYKLNRRIKSLKMKRRDEKAKLLQMEKSVEAQNSEIESLRRELSDSLDMIDDLRKDRASDRMHITKLNKQLKDAQLVTYSTREAKLEAELRQRNQELETTLHLLEEKVERIVKLETELEYALAQIEEMANQNRISQFSETTYDASFDGAKELQECETRCRQLERQNAMLKLLVQELEECWREGDDDDLESVFQKLPEGICQDESWDEASLQR